MLDQFIHNGKLSYHENVLKKGNISKDIMKLEIEDKTYYLLCTFNGLLLTDVMLIS